MTRKTPALHHTLSSLQLSSPQDVLTHTSTKPSLPSDSKPQTVVKDEENADSSSSAYSQKEITKDFMEFLQANPTVFHTVSAFSSKLSANGFTKLSERKLWAGKLEKGGKYFVERNGSSLIAFSVGSDYEAGNGLAMIAGHIDALTARLKPVSKVSPKAGYTQLGVAPYAGGLNGTWWDRDLGIAGRVLVADKKTGKVEQKLVKLDWPIARIPTLAPHFGAAANGPFNRETHMVPITGVDNSTMFSASDERPPSTALGGEGSFTASQPERLVKAICSELSIEDYSTLLSWELELFDVQAPQLGGLDKELLFAGRLDDKICSYAALEALLAQPSQTSSEEESSGIIKLVALFDDEEIGSLLRQGARGNFLPSTVERICDAFSDDKAAKDVLGQTYANSFLLSADVSHAVNPNFLGAYLENHAPRLNVGLSVSADPNGHMTTDAVSAAMLNRVAEKCGCRLQVFQIRNDSRSGGTVGPMLSSAMGVRGIDAGIVQLSMHSIRATTGSQDVYLGWKMFRGFLKHFEEVDAAFAST
ncbi:MAG: hypothetical protein M1833_001816 [Piccolia ochrophora]|nr:MAG: hypothetical protein M1833_001816 [Piccolia ochrophora]